MAKGMVTSVPKDGKQKRTQGNCVLFLMREECYAEARCAWKQAVQRTGLPPSDSGRGLKGT